MQAAQGVERRIGQLHAAGFGDLFEFFAAAQPGEIAENLIGGNSAALLRRQIGRNAGDLVLRIQKGAVQIENDMPVLLGHVPSPYLTVDGNYFMIMLISQGEIRLFMQNQSVILNIPKDLGDCLLGLPAIKRTMDYCAAEGLTLLATGSARSAEWVQTLGDIKLDVRDPKDLPQDAKMLVNLNLYDDTIHDRFPSTPYYAPENVEVFEEDTSRFGAGAVVGKKHVALLLEDCLKDAGIMKNAEHLSVPGLPPAFTDKKFMEDTQDKFGIKGAYAVLIPVCAANRPLKRWQKEKFAEVAQDCLRQGLTPVLMGGPSQEEKDLCAEINALSGNKAIDVCGKTRLDEIAAIARGAKFTLGCDTGPTHIAAQAGGQVFAFFGYYNDPATWQPMTKNNTAHIILGHRIQEIGVQEVLDTIKRYTTYPQPDSARHKKFGQ